MKQLTQNMSSGDTTLVEVPTPKPGRGQVLIRTTTTLVSLGTERMLVEFGKANFLEKARKQPDKVKQVLEKARAEGIGPTVAAVRNKLSTPLPLGYCNVGVVAEVGPGVHGLAVGDRVASNGAHADYVAVSENLTAKIPDGVTDEQAAFTVIAAIGLQGIRLVAPTFGETVVVYGLGLIGLLTARLLKANGCRVIGIDIDQRKLDIAARDGVIAVKGGDGVVDAILSSTGGVGADAVLITASAKVEAIISDAARMSRQRGRIVLVGVIPLNISRADFYTKELSFQVSCSYGPGRYDPGYEVHGQDYPLGFVRWTEQRNFEAVLAALANQNLQVDDLITERVPFDDYEVIYGAMGGAKIASLITYPKHEGAPGSGVRTVRYEHQQAGFSESETNGMAIVGAGNYTSATMLPMLAKAKAPLRAIVSRGGLSAATLAQKYQIATASTDYAEVLKDPTVGLVVITTRHNLHAEQTIAALEAGKHVFVEKPLALTLEELEAVAAAERQSSGTVTVGFNRRFSPHAEAIANRLPSGASKNIVATMNAGFIPADVWVHDPLVGGGRIVGEACHLIDLISYLTQSHVTEVCMTAQGMQPGIDTDNASLHLRYANGDLGVVHYFSNGSKAYSKERVEVHAANRSVIMDNFRQTTWYGYDGSKKLKTSLDKGHARQFALLTQRLREGGEGLIPFDSILNTSRAAILALESLRTNQWVAV